MSAYYNEWDKNAAAWLRELIKNGLIADGEVDERSITDVTTDDLGGFTQHHFFAGIGGWSYALRLAGVADDQRVWTASLPCQPFSSAGKQQGKADERHLLPHFLELVRQCQPNRIFGEQVEGAIRHGWLDDLQTTMEAEGYAIGHCVLGAHSVGAFHQRQRLYWVADLSGTRPLSSSQSGIYSREEGARAWNGEFKRYCSIDRLANTGGAGFQERIGYGGIQPEAICTSARQASECGGDAGGMVDVAGFRYERRADPGREAQRRTEHPSWNDPDWLYCRDNKYRPIKPGLEPLVDGVSERLVRSGDSSAPIDADKTQEARVMRLKGYGNAIVPQVAAAFIGAFMDISEQPGGSHG